LEPGGGRLGFTRICGGFDIVTIAAMAWYFTPCQRFWTSYKLLDTGFGTAKRRRRYGNTPTTDNAVRALYVNTCTTSNIVAGP